MLNCILLGERERRERKKKKKKKKEFIATTELMSEIETEPPKLMCVCKPTKLKNTRIFLNKRRSGHHVISLFEFLFFHHYHESLFEMKAVITGASGLLGRAAVKQFKNAGCQGK